ncbi:uncharacterized protein LOC115212171 [Octopus sinensis]|uniref:Uncharacterized protein LOC115212171 n=1 Tax=Octopus sinensis TaxID=2607531 RepID=A0A6P7SFD0_9MOLL|nr:uncharacterized protein LOC115212171 [Octopus sinensis]
MDIFTCVFCTSCLLLGCTPLTAAYFNEIGHMKTNHRVDILYKSQEDYPDAIQMVLTSPQTRLILNYTKTSNQFNIPIHVFNKNLNLYDVLDFGETKDSLIYEDKVHETLLTFHCHNFEPHFKEPCIFQSVFGIFYLDGHQHFIQPENFDKELWRQTTRKKRKKTYILPHNVYKTVSFQNHSCSLKNYDALNLNELQNSAPRIKRASQSTHKMHTIEVLALVDERKWVENKTFDEGLKEMQIYIAHVFKGIDNLYRNIQDKDVSFSVKLMGIVALQGNADKHYLEDQTGKIYINGTHTLKILTEEVENYFSSFDHVVMFSP